jgi:hypothetical protein
LIEANRMERISKRIIKLNPDEILDENAILELVNNSAISIIQASGYLRDETLEILNKRIFPQRKDIEFRIYGFYGHKTVDLSFLERLPDIERLGIDSIPAVSNIQILSHLERLRTLHLDVFRLQDFSIIKTLNSNLDMLRISAGGGGLSFDFDCAWLARFTDLRALYLGKAKKNIQSLVEIESLENLTLRGITVQDISFINELQLTSLAVHWGAISCFEQLAGNTTISSIDLWRISKLQNLDFLGDMSGLESINLSQLKNVTSLPDLSKLTKLREIEIDELKNLDDISGLEYVKGLREVAIYSGFSMTPEAIMCLFRNPSIAEINCFTGSEKKNQEIYRLCQEANRSSRDYARQIEWGHFKPK